MITEECSGLHMIATIAELKAHGQLSNKEHADKY